MLEVTFACAGGACANSAHAGARFHALAGRRNLRDRTSDRETISDPERYL